MARRRIPGNSNRLPDSESTSGTKPLFISLSTDNSNACAQTLLPNCLQAGKITSTPTFPLSRKMIDNIKRGSSNSFWRCRAAAFYLFTCPAEPRCIVSTTSSYGSHMYRQSRLCPGQHSPACAAAGMLLPIFMMALMNQGFTGPLTVKT
jgi:hypothetical protein